MRGLQSLRQGRVTCWYDGGALPDFSGEWFEPGYWQGRQAVLGQSRGRGITWFVQSPQGPMVLRHYWRGGLMGRLFGDRFCYRGAGSVRSLAEFHLLARLHAEGLPVPKPLAARLVRSGLFYRADLLIALIPGARDLVALLGERALTDREWHSVGALVRRLHEAGAYHSDLNSHNLLLDAEGKVWVIDFDKCGVRTPGSWQAQMLARLLRSLRKEAALHDRFYWQESDWSHLLAGYHGT